MKDYSKYYDKPPELLHFFQERNKLIAERKHVGRYTYKLKKRRKNFMIISIILLVLGNLSFVLFLLFLLFGALTWVTDTSYKKANAELEKYNEQLSDLGVSYKETYKSLYQRQKNASDNYHDGSVTGFESSNNYYPNECDNQNDDDCDCRDFANGCNDDFGNDADFGDYGGWDAPDGSADGCDGGGDFGGFDCDGGDGGDCGGDGGDCGGDD